MEYALFIGIGFGIVILFGFIVIASIIRGRNAPLTRREALFEGMLRRNIAPDLYGFLFVVSEGVVSQNQNPAEYFRPYEAIADRIRRSSLLYALRAYSDFQTSSIEVSPLIRQRDLRVSLSNLVQATRRLVDDATIIDEKDEVSSETVKNGKDLSELFFSLNSFVQGSAHPLDAKGGAENKIQKLIQNVAEVILYAADAEDKSRSGSIPPPNIFTDVLDSFKSSYGCTHKGELLALEAGVQKLRQKVHRELQIRLQERMHNKLNHRVMDLLYSEENGVVRICFSVEFINTDQEAFHNVEVKILSECEEKENEGYHVVGENSQRWDIILPSATVKTGQFSILPNPSCGDVILVGMQIRTERNNVNFFNKRTIPIRVDTTSTLTRPNADRNKAALADTAFHDGRIPYEGFQLRLPILFVNREDVLEETRRIFLSSGPTNTVIFFGMAKVGKTAVLQRLADMFSGKNHLFQWRSCYISLYNLHSALSG